MYSIYADGVCIYNDVFSLDNMKVIDPKLILEDSAAGSLEMTLPHTIVGLIRPINWPIRLKFLLTSNRHILTLQGFNPQLLRVESSMAASLILLPVETMEV